MTQRKSWSTAADPIHVYQNRVRHSCSVVGAIGAALEGGSYFEKFKTLNKETFSHYIRKLA